VGVAVAFGFQLTAATGSAVELMVDPGRSAVDCSMELAPFAPASCDPNDLLEFSGALSADLTLVVSPPNGVVVATLHITGASLGLSDLSWLVNAGPNLIPTQSSDLQASLVAPPTIGDPQSPGVSNFDLQGGSVTMGSGTIIGEHPLPPPLGQPIVHDFAVDARTHVFDANAVATASVSALGPGLYEVEVALPAASVFAVWSAPDPTASYAITNGEIVATAVVAGPPPATPLPIGSSIASFALGLLLAASGRQQVASS